MHVSRRNRHYFAPQNRQTNSRFHSGAEEVNRKRGTQMRVDLVTVFLGVLYLLFLKRESTAREMHRFPREIATPLPATCTLLHQLTMHFLPYVELWCCRHAVFRMYTVLIGRGDFAQSVACQFCETFLSLLVFYVRKTFPPRG